MLREKAQGQQAEAESTNALIKLDCFIVVMKPL